jgi:hypothetical protein
MLFQSLPFFRAVFVGTVLLRTVLLRQYWHSCKILISLTFLVVLLSGCNQVQFRLPNQWSTADLKMRVTPTNSPGFYLIDGTADLPDNTEITVAAVRYLYSADRASEKLNPDPTYSILAYQSVPVEQGVWHADLGLWQAAPNGQIQESWQLEQANLGLSLRPNSDVIFLATLAPLNRLAFLEQQLAIQGLRLAGGIIRTTADGQRYAQVNQTIAIAPPTGLAASLVPQPEDDNYGWGQRYLIPSEPQNPTRPELPNNRQTNAPPLPQEFLR